jgi:hypothetical protein
VIKGDTFLAITFLAAFAGSQGKDEEVSDTMIAEERGSADTGAAEFVTSSVIGSAQSGEIGEVSSRVLYALLIFNFIPRMERPEVDNALKAPSACDTVSYVTKANP